MKRAMALVVMVAMTVAVMGVQGSAGDIALETHVSSVEYSGTQGANNWYYIYKMDGNPKYRPCQGYNDANLLWATRDCANLIIGSDLMQNGNDGIPAKKWVATKSGKLRLTANTNIKRSIGCPEGDGVAIKIFKNNDIIYYNTIADRDEVGINYNIDVEVKLNDSIYFVTDNIGAVQLGYTSWNPVVEYTRIDTEPVAMEVHKASAEFVGAGQGVNNWFYGFMKDDNVFEQYQGFNAGLGIYVYSGTNRECANASVAVNEMHPGNDGKSIRRWVAPKEGTIVLTSDGSVRKNPNAAAGGGILVDITKNGEKLLADSLNGEDWCVGIKYNIKVDVKRGDIFDFSVANLGGIGYGATVWDPIISYIAINEVVSVEKHTASEEFGTTQGTNNWYYCYKNASNNFVDMEAYNGSWNAWVSSVVQFANITSNGAHPGDGVEVARKWVAPKAGNVVFTSNGPVKKDGASGDGVIIKIIKNDMVIYKEMLDWQCLTGFNYAVDTTVNKGDTIYFASNMNANLSNDSHKWDPVVTYTKIFADNEIVDCSYAIDRENGIITGVPAGLTVESMLNDIIVDNTATYDIYESDGTTLVGNIYGFVKDGMKVIVTGTLSKTYTISIPDETVESPSYYLGSLSKQNKVLSIKPGTLVASAEVSNYTDTDKSAMLIMAIYKDGKFVDVKLTADANKTIPANSSKILSLSTAMPENLLKGYSVKTFVVNNIENIKPMAEAVVIN